MIKGWDCPKCRRSVPLDHYESGACTAVPEDFAAAVLADSRKRRTEGIHVTSILGCPRKGAIEANVEVYANPASYNSMLGGTAWHKLMETTSNKPDLCEVDVAGEVAGVRLVGTVDRLHPPTAISDYKVTSEWAEKWLGKPKSEGGGMKDEHLAQMSLYAELTEQTLGWRPTIGTAWYRTHKAIMPFAEPLWSLETVLAFHPLGGDYSVDELIQQAASGVKWQELPMAGQSMAYGQKSACDYCAVRDTCWTAGFGAPF